MRQLTTTNYTNWLRHSSCVRIVMLIAIFNCQLSIVNSVKAQQENAAFYIYQNDGHFDGFFYNQVQKISYSKFDTLNVEHDDYVSQEIVTADSTYRIMLTAIDSVSFVQPEIKYNPKVRFMRDEGMTEFLIAADGLMLTFSTDMPATLRPATDDVLVCPDIDGELTTFVGKVVTSYEFDGKLVVHCKLIDKPSDIFEQFITVEEVTANETTGEVRRRIAGLKPHRVEGNLDEFNLFNFNLDFEHDWQLSDHWNLVTNTHVGFGASASLAYKWTLSEFYIKGSLKAYAETGLKIGLDGYVEGTFTPENIPAFGALLKRLSRIPCPANLPIMNVRVMPVPFIRGEAHLNVSLSTGVRVQPFRLSFEILDRKPWVKAGILNEKSKAIEGGFDLKAEVNGMVQTGIMFPFEIALEDWLANIYDVKIGETIYAGPKLTGSFTFASVAEGVKDNFYEAFKDMKLELSPLSLDHEFKVEAQPKLWSGKKHTFKMASSLAGYSIPMKLFPEIKDFKTEITGELNNNLKAKIGYIRGDVFLPQQIGVALYNKNDVVYKSAFRDETYSIINTFNDATVEIKDIEPGIYKIRPVIRLIGSNALTPIYAFEETFALGEQALYLKPTFIDVDEEGGEQKVEILSTSTATPDCYATYDWIHPVVDSKTMLLTVRVDENKTERFRKGVVYVSQIIEGNKTISDSLIVKQYGGISISKPKVDFDIDGGQEIIDVRTKLSGVDVNVKGGGDWLRANLGGETITITASKNNGGPRSAIVTLTAFNKAGDGLITASIEVTQKSLISVSIDTIPLANSGYYGEYGECAVVVNTSVPNLVIDVEKDDEAYWVKQSIRGNGLFVWADENNTPNERTTTIYVTAKNDNYNLRLPIFVSQEGNTAAWNRYPYVYLDIYGDEVEVASDGGEYVVGYQSNVEDVNASCSASWCRARIEDGQLTLLFEPNESGSKRECKLKLSVHNSYGSDEAEATIVQPSKAGKKSYDGWAFSIRLGGSIHDLPAERLDMISLPYTTPYRGVCGIGSAESTTQWSLTSHGSMPYGAKTQSWRAHFQNVKGVLYCHVYYEMRNNDDSGVEITEFSINSMPVGQVGLLSHASLDDNAGTTSWIGDGGATYWKPEDDSPSHVTYYRRHGYYTEEKDGIKTQVPFESSDPCEITVYLHIKGSSTIEPYCP